MSHFVYCQSSHSHDSRIYCLFVKIVFIPKVLSFTRLTLIWNSWIIHATTYLISVYGTRNDALWNLSIYLPIHIIFHSSVHSVFWTYVYLCRCLFIMSCNFVVIVSHKGVLDLQLPTEKIFSSLYCNLIIVMNWVTQSKIIGVWSFECIVLFIFNNSVTLLWFIESKGINMHQ